jgi:hypothetical protein
MYEFISEHCIYTTSQNQCAQVYNVTIITFSASQAPTPPVQRCPDSDPSQRDPRARKRETRVRAPLQAEKQPAKVGTLHNNNNNDHNNHNNHNNHNYDQGRDSPMLKNYSQLRFLTQFLTG